jgi:cobalt-zinc-cadmium efflux system outer membrane protein
MNGIVSNQDSEFGNNFMLCIKLIAVLLLAILLEWSFAPPSKAFQALPQENPPPQLAQQISIADLIDYAYRENPSIQSAREAWRSTVENYRITTGYPDPQIMVTYFPDPIETRLGPQDWNASISQKIPFPGKLSKAGEIVAADARIARLKLDKTIREVVVAIRESYHELLYVRSGKKVAAENMKLLDHLRKVSESSYAQDRAELIDMVKAQSQTGQLRYDILLLDDLEKTEITRLNGLLNRPPDADIGLLAPIANLPVVFSLEEIYAMAEAQQEEIQMTQIGVEKAELKMDLARYENLPDFNLGLFYSDIGIPDVAKPPADAGRDALGIQTGFTLPLWFGKNKSRILKAQAERDEARANKTERVNQTKTEIRSLFFRLENAHRLMELYAKELLPQAARSMELAETWFQEGESSFSDFIETQAVWYNFQLALARAESDYGKYLARLERLVGRSLTEKEVDSTNDSEKEDE